MQRRKQSGQLALGVGAVGSPQERGLLYKPELQSVADRVRYIERASSRYAHLPAALKSAPPGMRAPHLVCKRIPCSRFVVNSWAGRRLSSDFKSAAAVCVWDVAGESRAVTC